VQASFVSKSNGFATALGRVEGNLYVGSTSAGGEGDALDLDGDGKPDVQFDKVCKFVLQLDHGRVIAVEADRAVSVTIGAGAPRALQAYRPARI
jgi:hypothetical protein